MRTLLSVALFAAFVVFLLAGLQLLVPELLAHHRAILYGVLAAACLACYEQIRPRH
jgi:hypothetical protein